PGDGPDRPGERLLGRHGTDQFVRRRADRVHLTAEDPGLQVGAGREVPVERADTDARAARDVLERRVSAVLGERDSRGLDQLGATAPRVGPHPWLFARVAAGLFDHVHRLPHTIWFAKRRLPPYSNRSEPPYVSSS